MVCTWLSLVRGIPPWRVHTTFGKKTALHQTPHILCGQNSIEFGGIVGGTTGVDETGFYSGGAYEGRMVNAMIISGNLYMQLPLNHADGQRASGAGYICIDLRTGEQKWISEAIGVPYIGVFDGNASTNNKGATL